MPTLYEPFNMGFVKSLMTEYIGMTLFLVSFYLPEKCSFALTLNVRV